MERIEGVDRDDAEALGAGRHDVQRLGQAAVRHARRSMLLGICGFIPLMVLVTERWTVGFLALTAIALAMAFGASSNRAHRAAHRRWMWVLLAAFLTNLAYVPRLLRQMGYLGDAATQSDLLSGAPFAMALGILGFILLVLGSLQARAAEVEAHAALETEHARERARTAFSTAMERGKAHTDPGPITREEIEANRRAGTTGPMRPTPGPGTPSHVNTRDERHPNRPTR